MQNKRTIELINGALDGELSAAEQMEFNTLLAQSVEARQQRDSLSRLFDRLAQEPKIEPPSDLEGKLLREIPLPGMKAWFEWSAGWMKGKAASHGLAAAAGLMAAVVFYEFSPKPDDLSSLVGTLSRGNQLAGTVQLSSLDIDLPDVQGQVFLDSRQEIKLMRFNIDSSTSVELEINFADSGLRFGGFATREQDNGDSVVIKDGRFRITNQGAQKFSVILQDSPHEQSGTSGIELAIIQDGSAIYRDVLRP